MILSLTHENRIVRKCFYWKIRELATIALFVKFQIQINSEYDSGIIAGYPWLQKTLSTPIVLSIPRESRHHSSINRV